MSTYLSNNWETILTALRQHVWLALVPVVIGFVLALPIGYLGVRFPWLYHPLVNTCGVLYSIPSLALFVFLPVLLGTKILSPLNIVVALTIYTVALLARTVADGLRSVDALVVQSATAMGYRRLRRLIDVELPVALPVILAGLRVATVSNISLVSVGALIGVGGLGQLFTRGFQLFYTQPIIVGIVLSVALAGICDLAIVGLQRLVTPWTRYQRGAA
ncbi:osmoprotectant transport system permease protein [Actinoplanes tereljensis]|uniref:Glycine/betaine ABC transporter permease n=1 Tax=Paractinoplanes tereljensis TaxID=571912 RepID=A0A919NWM5_9ACTN|nr:ABC transporter permease [Actinoplanes tereljensis]GIF26575.1 glycine/betaine ABC transporter permease [Actinoplanes tereljensis]